MKIEIALYATLSQHLPPGAKNRKAVLEVRDGATAGEIMTRLGIPQDHPNILLVNGRQAHVDTPLKDGEALSIFPPIAGGRALSASPLTLSPAQAGSKGDPAEG